MPFKQFIALWLLVSLIAACNLMPQETIQPDSPLQAQMQPASYQPQSQLSQAKAPEIITFPSMVKTTALSEPAADKHQQLDDVLKELLKQDEQQGNSSSQAKPKQVEIVRFMAKANNPKHQIKTPETGSFKLVLEVGAKHEIVDADATDGEARIRMPAGSFETLLHLQGPWQPSSSLEIEDGLYYVKDTLDTKTGKLVDPSLWHLLGVRPVPVPQDWYSPDGQSFVLQFKAQDVKEFQIAWWREDGEAPFPPGMDSIGPEGGFLELPGVVELQIPEGAINTNQTIKLNQVLKAPDRSYHCLHEYSCTPGEGYISSVIRIRPVAMI